MVIFIRKVTYKANPTANGGSTRLGLSPDPRTHAVLGIKCDAESIKNRAVA